MEDLHFTSVDIHYNYAFDLGQTVNPIDAARSLLEAEFTGGFLNYVTGEQEMADRYKRQFDSYLKYLDVQDILKEMNPDAGLKPIIKLLLNDPQKWGPLLFRAFRESYSDESGIDDETTDTDDKEADEVNQTSYSQHQNTAEKVNVEQDEDDLDEVVGSVADVILVILGRLAIQGSVDQEIFHEDYLDKIPFVRVSLQPFNATLAGEDIHFDITVTIHRSGIAILTAYGSFSGILTPQELVALRRTSLLHFDSCEIPAVIINNYYSLIFEGIKQSDLQLFNEEFAAENRSEYVHFDEVEDEVVLAGIFDAYRYAIIETVQNKHYKSLDLLHQSLRSQQYFGYPVTFIKYPEVDSGKEFKVKNAETLARLIMGLQGSSQLKQEKVQEICSGDLSLTDGYSLYLTEGSAVVLDYGKSEYSYEGWLYETFMTSVVLDILILQRMILSIYELMLNQITLDAQGLDNLYKIKREHLLALDEYEVLGLSHYGSVHEIIERGQEIIRIRDVYNKFTQRLQNIEGLVQVAESKQRAKHERFTRVITTLISALLSLAVADNIIEIIGGWTSVLPSTGFFWWLQIPFTWIQIHPIYSTMVLYLTIFGTTLVAVWGSKLTHWMRRKQTAIPTTKPTRTTARTLVPLRFSVEKINGTVEEKDVPEERVT